MFRALKSRSKLPQRALISTSRLRTMASNAHRPANWKEAAPAPQPGPTFAGQATLPKLPLPELPETLLALKETLKPLARNSDEYTAVTAKIDDFLGGLGPTLHDRLVQRANERAHWLEEWWDDLGYLGYRDSVSCTWNAIRDSLTRLHRSSLTCRTIVSIRVSQIYTG